jgi:hypothetical protein
MNISQQKLRTLNHKCQKLSPSKTENSASLTELNRLEIDKAINQKSCETFLYLLGCFVSKVALFFSSKKQRYQHVNNQRVDMMKELNRFYFRKTLLQKGYY